MTTEAFIEFCQQQQRRHDAEQDKLTRQVARLSEDVASIHASRHAAQENLAQVVNEMRLDHNTLEKQVASLTNSIQELVIAMKGAYGGQGLVAQVNALATRVGEIEAARDEGKGMARLIGWGGGLLGAAAAIKSFLVEK